MHRRIVVRNALWEDDDLPTGCVRTRPFSTVATRHRPQSRPGPYPYADIEADATAGRPRPRLWGGRTLVPPRARPARQPGEQEPCCNSSFRRSPAEGARIQGGRQHESSQFHSRMGDPCGDDRRLRRAGRGRPRGAPGSRGGYPDADHEHVAPRGDCRPELFGADSGHRWHGAVHLHLGGRTAISTSARALDGARHRSDHRDGRHAAGEPAHHLRDALPGVREERQ